LSQIEGTEPVASTLRCNRNVVIHKETIRIRGVPVSLDAVRIDNQTFVISGKLITTAHLTDKDEWLTDVQDADEVIKALKIAPGRIDLLRFWQRIPDIDAKFNYYKEWRNIAAIPVRDYESWWKRQINAKTRNMVRKSQKAGVTIEQVEFSDHLIRGIMGIFNESPIRRGKPFWHYRKDFETVKKEMSADLTKAIFVAAYHGEELIGYTKLLVSDHYAMITMILDKMSHRDKSPMNGMIAKAVEVCAGRGIPHLVYTVWRRGEHGDFQKRNGFEKIPVPEYFVPLTLRGELALKLGLHKGIRGLIPEKTMIRLLALRAQWYSWKYRQKSG
jgi:hypothetical protein